jgi:hypothetical protein
MWNLVSIHSGMVFVSEKHRCMVCAKPIIGSKIVLDAPDGIQYDVGRGESCFGLFGDCVSVSAR